ncbi:hypothetical protein Tco_0389478 [Tanacetum coccineum]
MDVPIQQEIPPVLSAPLLDVLASVIPPQSTPTPTPLTKPIPAPLSSIVAPNVTTTVPDLIPAVVKRVSALEKEVQELKQVDHSTTTLASVRSHVPTVVNEYLGSTLGDTLHKILLPRGKDDMMTETKTLLLDQTKGKKKRQEDKSESSKKPSASKESSRNVEESTHEKAETNVDQPKDDVPKTSKTLNKNWFKQPPRPPTPDPEWNTVQTIRDKSEKILFNDMMHAEKPPLTFDELIATPINFSNFSMNRLKIDNLTQEVLLGPVYNLLKGHPGHLMVAAEYFFNNNLGYLMSGSKERRYTTSITKTKAAKRKLWYRSQINKFSPYNVYSNLRILSVVSVKVEKLYGYEYLKEIIVQRKLFNLKGSDLIYLAVALRMFARRIVIQKCVKDVQLGVKSYQKKLNLTRPQQDYPNINIEEAYTPSFDPPRDIYEDASNQKRLMKIVTYRFTLTVLSALRRSGNENVKKYSISKRRSFQDKEMYEHVGLEVTSSQEGKRSQDEKEIMIG